jgi:catechol 2,3-dioxygenase-like lactoylglutathione lyase family enzyme
MIDHVSIAVRDLDRAARFYQAVLGAVGYEKLVVRPRTVGFGKTYPEFWLNLRATMVPVDGDSGAHAALRVRTTELVERFMLQRLRPGARPTAYRACDRSTAKAIMPPLSAILTATASRRSPFSKRRSNACVAALSASGGQRRLRRCPRAFASVVVRGPV